MIITFDATILLAVTLLTEMFPAVTLLTCKFDVNIFGEYMFDTVTFAVTVKFAAEMLATNAVPCIVKFPDIVPPVLGSAFEDTYTVLPIVPLPEIVIVLVLETMFTAFVSN